LLDHAAQLKLNAVIFQVRPSCDALYASSLEPWSEYLTGTMGQSPEPFYDPLAFAITEAHRRGLALHAWLNPFRALTDKAKSAVSANHISRTHPEWVRRYGNQLWLDPGEPAVREYVWRVVQDVVLRYDVDGVQFDDYFYPYPTTNQMGGELEFPDEETWRKFGLPRKLSRDDWRRANINQFVQGAYATIKAAKPQVQFGISPFGIWRPMNPLPVRGLDAYAKLYADSRGWLINGWMDYFSPQLYWATDSPQQSFPALLNWWTQENAQQRYLWPGLSGANVDVKFPASEIARQIAITRQTPGASGEIFYHLRDLIDKPDLNRIVSTAYAQPALPPVPPSLQFSPPGQPRLVIAQDNRTTLGLRWESSGVPAWLWVLQCRSNQVWTTEILPAARTDWALPNRRRNGYASAPRTGPAT